VGVCVLRPQTRGFAADALRERKTILKTCGFAAGLPPTNLPLQKGELPRRKRRRSSKHPSSFFYNCFTTINCQNWGSYYMVSPNFGRNYNCGKMAIHLQKNRCVLEPLRFCAGVPFFVVGIGSFPFAAGICERSERVECAERTTRTLLKKRKCGQGNTYNNSYGVSFLPTHWKWWSRLPSS